MTPSAREVSLRRQEEEVVHDGDGVGDDPQQPVLPLHYGPGWWFFRSLLC